MTKPTTAAAVNAGPVESLRLFVKREWRMTDKTAMPKHQRRDQRRPAVSAYRERVAKHILERIRDGESLAGACAAANVPRAAFREWVDRVPGFADWYMLAKDFREDDLVDEANKIANNCYAGKIAPDAARAAFELLKRKVDGFDHELDMTDA